MDFKNFKPCLLIAMPELADPHFAKAVVLLTDYNVKGASGFVINRPTTIKLGEAIVLSEGRLNADYTTMTLWNGGPIEPEKIWIVYDRRERHGEEDTHIGQGVMIARSIDLLINHEVTLKHERMRIFHGYSGWGASQLDAEIAASFWLTVDLSLDLIFDVPTDQIWQTAIKRLGIDADKLIGPSSRFVN